MTPFEQVSWPVRTERLVVRPSEESDAAAFHAYRHLPEVSEWLPRLSTDLAAVTERFTDEDFRARTMVLDLDGRTVGDLYLHVTDGWAQAEVQDRAIGAQAEVGWCLDPEYQGRGLAIEAVRRLLGLCFEDLGIRRVVASCYADNTPSWRLMEKLGMRRESHTVRDSLHRDRGWVDGYTYALLAEEWDAAR